MVNEYTKQAMRRIVAEVDLDSVGQLVKDKVMEELQGVTSPQEAFQLKLRLDAVDEVILQMRQMAEASVS